MDDDSRGAGPWTPVDIGRVAPRYGPSPAITSASRERMTVVPLWAAWMIMPWPV